MHMALLQVNMRKIKMVRGASFLWLILVCCIEVICAHAAVHRSYRSEMPAYLLLGFIELNFIALCSTRAAIIHQAITKPQVKKVFFVALYVLIVLAIVGVNLYILFSECLSRTCSI